MTDNDDKFSKLPSLQAIVAYFGLKKYEKHKQKLKNYVANYY